LEHLTRQCSICHEEKKLEDFEKNPNKKFGRGYRCKTCHCKQVKERRSKNKELVLSRARALYVLNRESILARKRPKYKASYEKHKEKLIKRVIEYQKKRKISDPSYRALRNARDRVKKMVQGKICFSKSLGCSFKDFKAHIEQQFHPGMTWENYGEWHIDHKYPLSRALNEGPDSFAKACHYTNLQPLWALDNILKSNL
jgi:hypothetical protein